VIEFTGTTSRIVHRPLPQDDPGRRQPDISKANEKLGWAPQAPLREGLMCTIDFFETTQKGAIRPFAAQDA